MLSQTFFYLLPVLSYKPKSRIWFSASWQSADEKYLLFVYTEGLNIKNVHSLNLLCEDPLVNAIQKFERHPSITRTESLFEPSRLFDLNLVIKDKTS